MKFYAKPYASRHTANIIFACRGQKAVRLLDCSATTVRQLFECPSSHIDPSSCSEPSLWCLGPTQAWHEHTAFAVFSSMTTTPVRGSGTPAPGKSSSSSSTAARNDCASASEGYLQFSIFAILRYKVCCLTFADHILRYDLLSHLQSHLQYNPNDCAFASDG